MRSPMTLKSVAMTALCAVTLGTGVGQASAAPAAAEAPAPATAAATEQAQQPTREDVEQALNLIYEIPDDVLAQGDQATTAWLQKHNEGKVSTRASVLGCTGAIAALLGGTLVPAAKLLKIKKLIASLGGVKEAVQLMWGASFSYEKMQAAGGALAALGGELLGITAVKTQCFN